MDMFEAKKQVPDYNTQDYDIQLPISSLQELQLFEQQVQEINCKNEVVRGAIYSLYYIYYIYIYNM